MSITVNPWVADLEAYVPGEQPKDTDVIKLNTNECPYPPAPEVLAAVEASLHPVLYQKYPDPACVSLRTVIGERMGVPIEQILVGNGSDEILRLLCQAFLRPCSDDTIGVLNPSYILYKTLAAMFGARTEIFDLAAPDYALPQPAVESKSKIFFLPNPNPPLGTFYSADDLRRLAETRPDRLLVIDEAYVDFAPGDAMDLFREYKNVVITRTFSKSYSLAGLRVGFVIAREAIIAELVKIKDSYNVNRVSQAAAEAAWKSRDYLRGRIEQVRLDREFLRDQLQERRFFVPKSEGNFLFARRPDAGQIFNDLKKHKILTRYFDTPTLADGIRITIGTRGELVALLEALDSLHQISAVSGNQAAGSGLRSHDH